MEVFDDSAWEGMGEEEGQQWERRRKQRANWCQHWWKSLRTRRVNGEHTFGIGEGVLEAGRRPFRSGSSELVDRLIDGWRASGAAARVCR